MGETCETCGHTTTVERVSAGTLARAHIVLLVVWTGLGYPTVTAWSSSIRYLVFLSWYTIMEGHLSSWASHRAERKIEEAPNANDT